MSACIVGIDAHQTRAAAVALMIDGTHAFDVEHRKFDRDPEDVRVLQRSIGSFMAEVSHAARSRDLDLLGVGIEGVWAGPSARTVIGHALAVGAFIHAATRHAPHALVEVIQPRVARRTVGVTGAGKAPVGAWARQQYPRLSHRSEDVHDAALIAVALLAMVEPGEAADG